MKRMIATSFAIGLVNCCLADTTSIVSEKPKYWYRFDSDITTSVGVTNLAFSSTANSNIRTRSPWGYALRLDGGDGPWGSTFDVPQGDWTYHMRLKLPSIDAATK